MLKKAGSKISKKHTTLIPEAEPVIKKAQNMVQVSKVSLAMIKATRAGQNKRIKFTPIQAGLKAKIKGNRYVQEIYFYTKEANSVQQALTQAFYNS
ncbi:MAG: hypothetical protein GF332_02525 [Candidatus Moranbacteria bacterium]|nr:hypothetical protein [Candidatus Moranbacteria bacterium]